MVIKLESFRFLFLTVWNFLVAPTHPTGRLAAPAAAGAHGGSVHMCPQIFCHQLNNINVTVIVLSYKYPPCLAWGSMAKLPLLGHLGGGQLGVQKFTITYTSLSTSIYDLVLLDVCHFGHHQTHTFLSNHWNSSVLFPQEECPSHHTKSDFNK